MTISRLDRLRALANDPAASPHEAAAAARAAARLRARQEMRVPTFATFTTFATFAATAPAPVDAWRTALADLVPNVDAVIEQIEAEIIRDRRRYGRSTRMAEDMFRWGVVRGLARTLEQPEPAMPACPARYRSESSDGWGYSGKIRL